MDSIIKVSSLGKKYRLGQKMPYYSLRDSLMGIISPKKSDTASQEFWALKDVNFEVPSGQILGIIGRNGAGKSTLLKILSRITAPTTGEVRLAGRVASLLEVGTGFNPELTGRENVFLNGAILGMAQKEIKKKYQSIVDFAEIDRFMETPVKFYSSGMYVRLAFAVAAHLEAEILIVDEVLAVGDIEFQKKCLAKMGQISHSGRTILFVSHNLGAIESMCERVLVIKKGQLAMDAEVHAAVDYYFKSLSDSVGQNISSWKDREGTGEARVVDFKVTSLDGQTREIIKPGEPMKMQVTVDFKKPLTVDIGIDLESSGQWPFYATQLSDSLKITKQQGKKTFEVLIDPNPFRLGNHSVTLRVLSPDRRIVYDCVYHLPGFQIDGFNHEKNYSLDYRPGELYFSYDWKEVVNKKKS